jgi:biotin synthase-like enzyme
MIAEAGQAKKDGAEFFGIVTSGKSIKTKKEWKEIFKAIEGMNKIGITPCASLGMIKEETARELKAPGFIATITTWKRPQFFQKYLHNTRL